MATARESEGSIRPPDLLRLAFLTGAGIGASLVPQGLQGWVVDRLLAHHPASRPDQIDKIASIMRETLGATSGAGEERDWRGVAETYARMSMEDSWGRFCGLWPGRWKIDLEVSGTEHLRAALAKGKGAMLWGMRFSSATALKQGLHKAGFPVVHLSVIEHGAGTFSDFALKWIGPMFCRPENQYLAERIQIPLGNSLAYLQTLRDRLRENKVVSIFGDQEARQMVEVPFLNSTRGFAPGAPSIAYLEGAELLTVYALRTGPFAYRVVVEPAVDVDRALPRKQFVQLAVAEFGKRNQRLVERYPSDWQEWLEWEKAQCAAGAKGPSPGSSPEQSPAK